MQKTALVTGGNRGIGREICRQLAQQDLTVLLGSRDLAAGEDVAAALREETGGDVRAVQLDVSSAADSERLRDEIAAEFGRLDVLVNNAGILIDRGARLRDVDVDDFAQTMAVNVFAPLRLIQTFLPLLEASGHGRIVNVSSKMGQLDGLDQPTTAYRFSKVNLNYLTRVLATQIDGSLVKINAMSPGWVRTDMGGSGADRSVAEGADTAVWLATLPDDGPHGGFFHDRQPIPW